MTVLSKIINAQEVVADSPDQTKYSTIIPNKNIQIEMGLESRKYNNENLSLLPTALLRYGTTGNIELRLVEQLVSFKKESINTKIAFISHVFIPSGSSKLTNTNFGTINRVTISYSFSDLGYNYFRIDKDDLVYSDFIELTSSLDSGLIFWVNDNLQFDFSIEVWINPENELFSLGFS